MRPEDIRRLYHKETAATDEDALWMGKLIVEAMQTISPPPTRVGRGKRAKQAKSA